MAEEKKKQKFIEVDEYGVEYYKDPAKLQELINADHDLVRGLWPIDPLSERWPLGYRPDPENPKTRIKTESAREFAYNSFKKVPNPKSEIVLGAVKTEQMKLDILQKMIDGQDATEEKRALMMLHREYGSRRYFEEFGAEFDEWPPSKELITRFVENVKDATREQLDKAFEIAVEPYKKKWGLETGQLPSQQQLNEVNEWFKEYAKQLKACVKGRPQDFSN